jgi:hypothetical protein
MVWPFKPRPPAEPCPPIGQYRIDTKIDDLEKFLPLSPEELVLLNPGVMFEEEQILHAPRAHFMDLQWDTILGIVHGEIYKISIQWTGPRDEVGTLERQIKVYCTKHYGKGENGTIWYASDGNIIVYGNNFGSEAILNVFVTSRKVRQFKRA